jgi:hypothetical protein
MEIVEKTVLEMLRTGYSVDNVLNILEQQIRRLKESHAYITAIKESEMRP